MISRERLTWDEEGQPTLVVTIEGWSDVFRFAFNLIHAQSDFCSHGVSIFKGLRRHNARATEHFDQSMADGKVASYMGWRSVAPCPPPRQPAVHPTHEEKTAHE